MELTKQGYNLIIDRIVNRKVEPPSGYTLNELGVYLTAYAKCQNDIIDLIIRLRNEIGTAWSRSGTGGRSFVNVKCGEFLEQYMERMEEDRI